MTGGRIITSVVHIRTELSDASEFAAGGERVNLKINKPTLLTEVVSNTGGRSILPRLLYVD
jgi:hypothetical protein